MLSVKAVLTVCAEARLIAPLDRFVVPMVPETLAPKLKTSPPDLDEPISVREMASSPNIAALDRLVAVGVFGRDTEPVLNENSPN